MKNIKDTASTICGIVIAICSIVLGLPTQGIALPNIVIAIATIFLAVAGGILGFLTGKKPDGTAKIIDKTTGQEIK